MSSRFTYEKIGDSPFGLIYRPVAKVLFNSIINSNWVETTMIVDTGADFTILPRVLAQKLEISIRNDCVKHVTRGVGGNQIIYISKQKVNARIGGVERMVPVAFFDNNDIPPLLGRLGFLETFDTEFLKSHAVVFKG